MQSAASSLLQGVQPMSLPHGPCVLVASLVFSRQGEGCCPRRGTCACARVFMGCVLCFVRVAYP